MLHFNLVYTINDDLNRSNAPSMNLRLTKSLFRQQYLFIGLTSEVLLMKVSGTIVAVAVVVSL